MRDSNALRARMVAQTADLFYAEGFTATGVDRIAEVVGVSKRTLYKHFGSKDALIEATLTSADETIRHSLLEAAEGCSPDPREQIEGLFSILTQWLQQPGFRGCPFINVSAETPDAHSGARAAARRHKQDMRRWIRDRATAARLSDPESLSHQVAALLDGAMSQRLVLGEDAPTAPVADALAVLLDARTVSGASSEG